MAQVRHQGGAIAEAGEELVERLLATGEWEVVGDEKPAPVKRARKAATPKVEESATEE